MKRRIPMNDTFSKNLRKLRLDKQMTQEQVADKLGVSAQSVSRWETGATFPDILLLPEIAKLYSVLVDDLYKEHAEGYENYAARLFAVYETTWKHEDFLAVAQEFERMEKAGTMTPNDYRSYALLHDYMASHCTKRALALYDKAMELSKESDTELYHRCKRQKITLRIQRGDGAACIHELKQDIAVSPRNAEEYISLVSAHFWMKEYETCYEEVKKAIAKFPQVALLYSWAGDACRELKKYDEAFFYWNKHLELDSKWLDSHYSMGFCYEEIGDYAKAYETWTTLSEILFQRGGVIEAEWSKEMAQKCKEKMGK